MHVFDQDHILINISINDQKSTKQSQTTNSNLTP